MPARTLTQGSITRQLIGLTLPLLLGNLIQQFYNTVDMMIVGQVAGETPFAAIGVAGSLMSLFTCLLIGFNMGCSILFANRFGAQDFDGLRHTLFTTGVILAGVTVLLTGLGLVFWTPSSPSSKRRWSCGRTAGCTCSGSCWGWLHRPLQPLAPPCSKPWARPR